jgi:O-antigen ligase
VAIVRTFGAERETAPRYRSLIAGISVETVFLLALIACLAWVPFWHGSNRLISWGINAFLFPGLAALYAVSCLFQRVSLPITIRDIRWPAILFLLVSVWIFVQNATWTPASWQHPIWQLASEVLDRHVAGSISVDRDLTALALTRLVTAASALWLALQLTRDYWRAKFLLWSIVAIGAVYAAIGLYALQFAPGGAVFVEQPPSVGPTFLASTFANQSHYATFAGIGLISAVALISRIYERALPGGAPLRFQIAAVVDTTAGKALLPLLLAFLIMGALLLTGSRGGIISTGLGLVIFFALQAWKKGRFGRVEVGVAIIILLSIIGVFIAFGDALLEQVGRKGFDVSGRYLVYLITIRSILSSPILGYGYGTFSSVFPMFRDDSLDAWTFWDTAHNTHLEVLQGLGLIFGPMLMLSVLLLAWRCLKGAITLQRGATFSAVAVSATLLVGVHAFVDLSLQIQAVTLTYMAVLGAGVAQSIES